MAEKKCSCPCGTNPIAIKDTKAKFCHERIKDPKKFDPKSFRTKVYRAHRITFGCPKGKYSKGVCKVPVQVQAILHPVGEAKCPTPGAMIKKNPFLETSLAIATGITVGEVGKYAVKKSGILKNPGAKLHGDEELNDYLNKKVKKGDIIISRHGLLGQDFHTKDGYIRVISKRIGGGFTRGRNIYELTEGNKPPINITLEEAYKKVARYLKSKKLNPGAKWHEDEEIYNDRMESRLRDIKDKEEAHEVIKRLTGKSLWQISQEKKNPMYHGRAKLEALALRLCKSGWGVDSVIMELKKKFDVPSSVAEYIAKQAARISRGEIKDNPKAKCLSKNTPKGATKIYDRILSIEAKKGKNSNFPNENFRHDFSSKDAEILGMPDGSLKIRSKTGKKLWKNFNYPEKGNK